MNYLSVCSGIEAASNASGYKGFPMAGLILEWVESLRLTDPGTKQLETVWQFPSCVG